MIGIGYELGRGSQSDIAAAVRALFLASEQGAWYDPSDFSTLYQDSTGTTPVTAVEQPVGLMLDKRVGTQRGANRFTNSDNEAALMSPITTANVTVARGAAPGGGFAAVATCVGTADHAITTSPLAANTTFEFSGRVYVPTGSIGNFRFFDIGDGSWFSPGTTVKDQWVSFRFIRPAKSAAWALGMGSNVSESIAGALFYLDDVVVQAIGTGVGNHALQATAASRPVLSSRVNLLNHSQDFTNALWTKASSATATATQITFTTNTSYVQQVIAGVAPAGAVITFSVIASCPTTQSIHMNLADSSDGVPFHTQVISITSTPTRFTFTQTMGVGAAGSLAVQLSGGSLVTAGSVVTFSEVQVQVGSTATRYQRTGPLRNLLTKTDLMTDTGVWYRYNIASLALTSDITPDGKSGAAVLMVVVNGVSTTGANSDGGIGYVPSPTFVSGQTVTYSIYAKAATGSKLRLREGTSTGLQIVYDLSAGTIISGGGNSAFLGAIESVGNGWYRCSATRTLTATAMIVVAKYGESAGDGVSGILLWGAQHEVASAATPYERVDTATTTYDTVGFPVGLRCDGVDDGMATSAIDFSATDKMTVWAAVQKLSDAAAGSLMELSVDSSVNNGAFEMRSPSGASATYALRVRGTASIFSAPAGYAAPITNVLVAKADIAGDSTDLRVNGASTSPTVTDLGTGNFGNHVLYLFRRAGASLPFNGLFYGAIIRGAAATALQIRAIENYLAQKSAVTLAVPKTQITQLFAASEQGAWYDPSDLSTLYQDSMGLTPVTAVEQPVGLMLDKRLGAVRSADSLVNGAFTDGSTGWTVAGTDATHIATFSGGTCRYQSDTTTPVLSVQQTRMTIGKTYEITAVISSWTSGSIKTDSFGTTIILGTGVGTVRAIGVATVTTFSFIRNVANVDLTVDSVSVKEIVGNHALQATAASRPVLSARQNLLLNSENFDAWADAGNNITVTPNAGTTPGGHPASRLVITSGTDWYVTAYASNTSKTYLFSAWVKAEGTAIGKQGALYAERDGYAEVFQQLTPVLTGAWQFVSFAITFVTTPGVVGFRIDPTEVSSATGDSVLIGEVQAVVGHTAATRYQRVTTATDYDSAGFPRYLACDGVDDGMATAAVDFSATDKMTVWAAVHKASDAALGTILETSVTYSSYVGTFAVFAPSSAAANYSWRAAGTAAAGWNSAATYPAPRTDVMAVSFDLAGAAPATEVIPRINGQLATGLAVIGTDSGTGNFGNHALYLFRRGGVSSPFNGKFYGAVIRGAASNAEDITFVETLLTDKTQATMP